MYEVVISLSTTIQDLELLCSDHICVSIATCMLLWKGEALMWVTEEIKS